MGLLKKADYKAKITEIEGKTLSISGLATKAALTVENRTPDISKSVKQTGYTQKYQGLKINITTAVYKKLTKDLVNNQIKSKNLVNRSDTADFINGAELNKDS